MKVPANPPSQFVTDNSHLRSVESALWRIFRTEGPHAGQWNELRHYGPIPRMRFEPHPPPRGMHPNVGVMYAAADPMTALAEVYQRRRVIDRSEGGPTLVSWRPQRSLQLLDLTSNWPVLNGAASSIMMGSKRSTQAWAQVIEARLGDHVDGLYHQSAMTGRPLVTLFTRAERWPSVFPDHVDFSTPIASAGADEIVSKARKVLGYESM